jgi:hypothetical protein
MKTENIIQTLIEMTNNCQMTSKHSAMLLCGGKPITSGYNHPRTCNHNRETMSYHAEMHVLSKYLNLNNEYSLSGYMNDSPHTLMGKKKESYLLREQTHNRKK